MKIRIEKPQSIHIDQIFDIGCKTIEYTTRDIVKFWPRNILYQWYNHDCHSWVVAADSDSKIVGFLLAAVSLCGIATIENIFVSEDARNRGIGQLLIMECERRMIERNIYQLRTFCSDTNIAAIKLFKKNNFVTFPTTIWLSHNKNNFLSNVSNIQTSFTSIENIPKSWILSASSYWFGFSADNSFLSSDGNL